MKKNCQKFQTLFYEKMTDTLNTRLSNCDSIVQTVVEKFVSRAEFGRKKYGKTMDRDDLTTDEWICHAVEEAMDMILYLSKLQIELQKRVPQSQNVVSEQIPAVGFQSPEIMAYWENMSDERRRNMNLVIGAGIN